MSVGDERSIAVAAATSDTSRVRAGERSVARSRRGDRAAARQLRAHPESTHAPDASRRDHRTRTRGAAQTPAPRSRQTAANRTANCSSVLFNVSSPHTQPALPSHHPYPSPYTTHTSNHTHPHLPQQPPPIPHHSSTPPPHHLTPTHPPSPLHTPPHITPHPPTHTHTHPSPTHTPHTTSSLALSASREHPLSPPGTGLFDCPPADATRLPEGEAIRVPKMEDRR